MPPKKQPTIIDAYDVLVRIADSLEKLTVDDQTAPTKPTETDTAPAEPDETPVEAPETPVKTLTVSEVLDLTKAYVGGQSGPDRDKRMNQLAGLLAQFDVKKVTELPDERLTEFTGALSALENEEGEG